MLPEQPANVTKLGRARLHAIGGGDCLLDFLENRLIPDLLESGREATAEDFSAACCLIRQLKKHNTKQAQRLTRAIAHSD